MAADIVVMLGEHARHDFTEQATSRDRRQAGRIGDMRFGVIRIGVKLDAHLFVEERAGICMRGSEISHEIGDQIIVAVAILLEQQVTVIVDIARIVLKPSRQRSLWWWANMQGQCRTPRVLCMEIGRWQEALKGLSCEILRLTLPSSVDHSL